MQARVPRSRLRFAGGVPRLWDLLRQLACQKSGRPRVAFLHPRRCLWAGIARPRRFLSIAVRLPNAPAHIHSRRLLAVARQVGLQLLSSPVCQAWRVAGYRQLRPLSRNDDDEGGRAGTKRVQMGGGQRRRHMWGIRHHSSRGLVGRRASRCDGPVRQRRQVGGT